MRDGEWKAVTYADSQELAARLEEADRKWNEREQAWVRWNEEMQKRDDLIKRLANRLRWVCFDEGTFNPDAMRALLKEACPDCGHTDDEEAFFEEKAYECSQCGQTGVGEEGKRCSSCNRFAAKVSDMSCPECQAAIDELDEVTGIEVDGEFIKEEDIPK